MLAAKARPALFVIDLDPPIEGIVDFISALKAEHATAHVLAIGCGTSPEVQNARAESAIRFIEKPFELADFGEMIRELLGEGAAGTLADFDVADLIQLQCVNAASGAVIVKSLTGDRGEIHFAHGQLRHAIARDKTGVAALAEMLGWPIASCADSPPITGAPVTIEGRWADAVIEALRTMKRRRTPASPRAARPPPARTKKGRKIIVIDDTETLLIFVEDILSRFDPDAQIITAHTGTEGVRRAELLPPDLVLVDFDLPDINGDEVCRRLLESRQTSNVPVVMMSGHVAEMLETARKFENVVGTIAKPFLSNALIALVEKTLAAGPRAATENVPTIAASEITPAAPAPPAEIPPQKPASPTSPLAAEQAPATPTTPPPEKPSLPAESFQPEHNGNGHRAAPESHASGVATAIAEPPERHLGSIAEPVSHRRPTAVVLVLALEAIAVEFTSFFEIGTIRARLSSPVVALRVPPSAPGFGASVQKGFDLGRISVSDRGGIETVRLMPTRRPFATLQTRSQFEIGAISVTPGASRMQLTATAGAPMAFQLLAPCEIAAVELAADFEVAHLVLKLCDERLRVAFGANGGSAAAPAFTAHSICVDPASHLRELVLAPAVR